MHERFFPGPQGIGANVVGPMTDWSLPDIDGDRLTPETLEKIIENTGRARQRLRSMGLAQGNKIASEMKIVEVTATEILIELYGGPTLRDDVTYKFRLPQTPATLRVAPKALEELLEVYAEKMMGGNISNVFRNQLELGISGLGPAQNHVFCPTDRYLDAWMQDRLQKITSAQIMLHDLEGMNERFGFATPYRNESAQIQQFSFNKPQSSTVEPMQPWIDKLRSMDYVVVSEGLGTLLRDNKIAIVQIFNPTSALHVQSALQMLDRKNEGDNWQDVTIVNDDEMGDWIRIMENKQNDVQMKDIPDAKFPMPFLKSDRRKIDEGSVNILRESHRRFLNLGQTRETENVGLVVGIGCGPKGGQNQFQSKGKHYIAAASAFTDEGAERLLNLCGPERERAVRMNIRDVVGAGDAAFTASLIHRNYSPLEEIVEKRHPNLSAERKRIAVMAFTTILQRVFGELVYHSKVRDLSEVPSEAFPIIFDKTLDKSIDAALQLTTIDKVPSKVYHDDEWDIGFMVMELETRDGASLSPSPSQILDLSQTPSIR